MSFVLLEQVFQDFIWEILQTRVMELCMAYSLVWNNIPALKVTRYLPRVKYGVQHPRYSKIDVHMPLILS